MSYTTSQMASFTPQFISTLSTLQITSLNSVQIRALRPYSISGIIGISLLTSQIPYFTTAEILNLLPQQISLIVPSVILRLSTDQIQAITPNALNGMITGQIINLSTLQIAVLTTSNISGFNSSQLAVLSTAQTSIIQPKCIPYLLMNALISLSTLQISVLLTSQVAALSTRQLSIITQTQASSLTLNQANTIINNININSQTLSTTQLILVNKDIHNNIKYDYSLNCKLSYTNNNNITWNNSQLQPIINTQQISLKMCKFNSTFENVLLYTNNSNNTNQINIMQNNSDPISIPVEANTRYFLNNITTINQFTPKYFPNLILTASLQPNIINSIDTSSKFNIYLITIPNTTNLLDILTNRRISTYTISDPNNEKNTPNKQIYCQMSNDGKVILITYYYYNSLITDPKNISKSKYFIISYNSFTTNIMIDYTNIAPLYYYRHIVLSADGNRLFLLSYPIIINNTSTYKSILYFADITNKPNNMNWCELKEFILPNYGYCPIFNVSYDGKYITLYYNDSIYCNIYMSSNYGRTWTLYKSNYNIYNVNRIDISTMSQSGLYQTYLISNKNTSIYMGYFANNKWNIMYSDDTLNNIEQYPTYCITDDYSNIILYIPNFNVMPKTYSLSVITLNDLFNNLDYNYSIIQNTAIIDNNLSLHIQNFNSVLNYCTLYSTVSNNILFNTVESFGMKILRIINNKIPNAIYSTNLFNNYSIILNTIINNNLGSTINNLLSNTNIKQLFMTSYILTNKYIDDTNLTSQSLTTIQIGFNLDNLVFALPLQLSFSNNNINILLQISY